MIYKNYISAALGLALLAGTSGAKDLVISEIVDGTLPGGLPKFIELTNNTAGTVDLSGFTFGVITNSNTTFSSFHNGGMSFAMTGMVPAGESYVISLEGGDFLGSGGSFFTTYGCEPDNFDAGTLFNGDDRVYLFLADGSGPLGEAVGFAADATVHDIYGEPGVDGTGTVWEYIDSYANRIGTSASAVFDPLDWNFGGANLFDTGSGCMTDDICEAAFIVANTSPTPLGGCNPPPAAFPDLCNGNGDIAGCGICPCGNEAPSGTIGGCLNRAGTATRIYATGDTSTSLPTGPGTTTDLRFNLDGAPGGTFCVLISGDAVAPLGAMNMCTGMNTGIQGLDRDGLRCAVTSTRRHGGRSANLMGVINDAAGPSRVWGGEAQPHGGIFTQGGFVSGQTRYFQVTHRENPAFVCGRGLNTSQAIEVVFTP